MRSADPWRGWLITGGIMAMALGFGILAAQNHAAEWLLSRFIDLFNIFTIVLTIVGGMTYFGFWLYNRMSGRNRRR